MFLNILDLFKGHKNISHASSRPALSWKVIFHFEISKFKMFWKNLFWHKNEILLFLLELFRDDFENVIIAWFATCSHLFMFKHGVFQNYVRMFPNECGTDSEQKTKIWFLCRKFDFYVENYFWKIFKIQNDKTPLTTNKLIQTTRVSCV